MRLLNSCAALLFVLAVAGCNATTAPPSNPPPRIEERERRGVHIQAPDVDIDIKKDKNADQSKKKVDIQVDKPNK